ncbi:MAG: 2-C-methyl-D-erythritol 2,4-cyclodiphosphate synthase [Christensenellales bacterium]|jgi:2-C-methyl-D-erythritol 4-phosphate cytidylyltransferase/2-C-methyl-D-erythritol 2,4-cyclodiphosphate synthase
MKKCWAVVLAAGKGTRTHLPYNKVLYEWDGKTVLERTLESLLHGGHFEGVVIAFDAEDEEKIRVIAEQMPIPCILARGGDTRTASCARSLESVPKDVEIIAIHDAARAFVPENLVAATLASAAEYGSGVASTRVTDTIKIVREGGFAVSTPDREMLRAVQTPQAFSAEIIRTAYRRAAEDGISATDDASLVERYIGPVHLVETEDAAMNIKITHREDLPKEMPFPRTGVGYDAHRLVEGRKLVLGGVEIPYEKGLLGHSDADVCVHALIDALLGAAAQGDIGQLFPDSDGAYGGISSLLLLERTKQFLKDKGYRFLCCDISIVAQRPKLAPYIPQMRQCIADALDTSLENVSVKATTTEGMGFEGAGEGISAQAVATVILDTQSKGAIL